MKISQFIRDVADFPKPGVTFKDLTPLLADGAAFIEAIEALVAPFREQRISRICAMEARGFIFGAAAATALGCGFVPLRKPGKLPAEKVGIDYALEYGFDRLEMHADALIPGDRVLIVDDVLATGGTLAAAAELIERNGGEIVGAALIAEIAALGGRARWLRAAPLHVLVTFE
jgi:adenine phosphoribosyltransferase